MNALILIDAIVRQTTVLIGQLATSGGIRAPLAHLANQVFLELAQELEAQGVSRKVSADMFGMALRAYIRKVRRLSEAKSEQGRTLWQSVLDFVKAEGLVSRERVIERFRHDGEVEVSAVLRDLTESGLVFCSGAGRGAAFRAASDDELAALTRFASASSLDELAWVLTYRHGPVKTGELARLLRQDEATTEAILARLVTAGRVQAAPGDRYVAQDFVIPLGSSVGWEAAVLDHVQAVVQTVCQRLEQLSPEGTPDPAIGGSTYSFDVWPGHPLEDRVKGQLAELRDRLGALRREVQAHNDAHGVPPLLEQVITYVGQCIIERDITTEEEVDS
jgi:hypothetical protein